MAQATQKNAPAKNVSKPAAGFTEQTPTSAEQKKAKKREKKVRTLFGERVADGGRKGDLKTPIKGKVVEGFDSKKHLPLRKGDFENPSDYLDWKADRLEVSVKRLREQANDERSLGSVEQRKAVKKAKSIAAKFKEIQETLKATGMSAEQIAQYLNG